MKPVREDFPLLAKPLVFLLMAAFWAVTAPIMGQRFLHRMNEEESSAEKALSRANDMIRQVARELAHLDAYRKSYARLVEEGAFGDFRRIDLVEHMEKSGPHLFDLQYSISPRQKMQASDLFALSVNRAVFRLNLLHEGGVLDFLGSLDALKSGIPLVAGCAVERVADAGRLTDEPHLRAECTVIWVTMAGLKR